MGRSGQDLGLIRPPTTKLDPQTMDSVFGQVAAHGYVTDGRPVRIDLSDLQFVAPAGLTGIVLVVRELSERGWYPEVIFPKCPAAAFYVSRMQLESAVEDCAECTGRVGESHKEVLGTSHALLEVMPIEGRKDADGLLKYVDEQVRGILAKELGYEAKDVGNFANVLSELAHNIIDHSESSGCIAAQSYRRRDGSNFALVSVGDRGIGLRGSLAKRFDVSSWTDSQVILNALRPEYSRHPDRGMGLAFVKKVCKDYRGSLDLSTGRSRVFIRGSKGRQVVRDEFPGTQISISLREAE